MSGQGGICCAVRHRHHAAVMNGYDYSQFAGSGFERHVATARRAPGKMPRIRYHPDHSVPGRTGLVKHARQGPIPGWRGSTILFPAFVCLTRWAVSAERDVQHCSVPFCRRIAVDRSTYGETVCKGHEKIIIQPCLSFYSASALRQVLHILIFATCRALNLSKNPAQSLDNYYFPWP